MATITLKYDPTNVQAEKLGLLKFMKVKMPRGDKKKLMELAKTIKQNGTRKAFEKAGIDYDSYNRQ
ncbi:MAG: hypothetical protein LBE36_08560 [Flavobacteriaceae bacterium]|jgi:hypothetical protein|nr:hypothetical protein [Flavobacteriaceae bacterium]